MAKIFFLQSTVTPEIRFQILARDKETGIMKLKGAWAEFEEVMTKELMDTYKYTVVVEEAES